MSTTIYVIMSHTVTPGTRCDAMMRGFFTSKKQAHARTRWWYPTAAYTSSSDGQTTHFSDFSPRPGFITLCVIRSPVKGIT